MIVHDARQWIDDNTRDTLGGKPVRTAFTRQLARLFIASHEVRPGQTILVNPLDLLDTREWHKEDRGEIHSRWAAVDGKPALSGRSMALEGHSVTIFGGYCSLLVPEGES